MLNAQELRKGHVIRHEGVLYKIIAADYHVGGGKAGGMVHAKMRNLSTGHLTEHRFASHDKIDDMDVHRQTMDFLYLAAEECCFMNPESFEQVSMPKAGLGPIVPYLKEGMKVDMEFMEGAPISVDFPPYVEVTVTSTAAGIKGDTDSTYKTAVIDNDLEVLVPQFIKTGDTIKVDIESGKYLERVQKKA
jgi:elongation factor P